MKGDHRSERQRLYLDALQQLRDTIVLLDSANAPGHIAANLDHAMHQLQDAIEREFAGARYTQIERKAAPQ